MVDSLLDSWMLQHFPGRFLDEIDEQMDVFRFLRALDARSVESIEKLRTDYANDSDHKIKLTDAQMAQMDRHDRLINRLLDDAG